MATTTQTRIDVTRTIDQDAAKLAAEVAKGRGTQLNGNMRWQYEYPLCRSVRTKDGRTIRILEPTS